MVRKKIEIKPIEEKPKRHTTFTKRRKGLIKKAKKFFEDSESDGAVIAFSKAGNVFEFAHPAVEKVLDRYGAASSSALDGEAGNSGVGGRVHDAGIQEEEETVVMMEAQRRIGEVLKNGNWNEVFQDLGLEELDELHGEMERIKRKLEARERDITATVKGTQEFGFSDATLAAR